MVKTLRWRFAKGLISHETSACANGIKPAKFAGTTLIMHLDFSSSFLTLPYIRKQQIRYVRCRLFLAMSSRHARLCEHFKPHQVIQ
jgi:hypothetical protein